MGEFEKKKLVGNIFVSFFFEVLKIECVKTIKNLVKHFLVTFNFFFFFFKQLLDNDYTQLLYETYHYFKKN